jgi:hypothetical protein
MFIAPKLRIHPHAVAFCQCICQPNRATSRFLQLVPFAKHARNRNEDRQKRVRPEFGYKDGIVDETGGHRFRSFSRKMNKKVRTARPQSLSNQEMSNVGQFQRSSITKVVASIRSVQDFLPCCAHLH